MPQLECDVYTMRPVLEQKTPRKLALSAFKPREYFSFTKFR